ncbi:MAG: tyrosine--tRNA ligase [Oligoflexia bacterium]|nr:tyrosine--tRNA ligase [Oligoflexia bacterium]
MTFIEELEWRGLIQDMSDPDGLRKLPAGTAFYLGMDPTAPSLQIGNLVPIVVSLHLAKHGLKPIMLFGGSTGSIGDPSGRRTERQLLDRATIDENVRKHSAKVLEIFKRAGLSADFVNNYDWTAGVSVLDFLRDVGKHFTINYMLAKEFVKSRVETDSISYTEFSYMLLQAFDFYHLFTQRQCRLQVGGSDQWGNITAGLELIRRKNGGEAYALSIPLITDNQGRKFGKSEGGAVWLDGSMTSPYKFHQFWLNVEDASVGKFLRIFTFKSKDEILALEERTKAAPEKREAQIALADAVCTLVHGEEATQDAKRCAQVLFGGSLDGIPETKLAEIFSDVPSTTLARAKFNAMTVVDLLAETKLSQSKGEARRLISSGGAYINNGRISDPTLSMAKAPYSNASMLVLRAGKKQYHLLRVAS